MEVHLEHATAVGVQGLWPTVGFEGVPGGFHEAVGGLTVYELEPEHLTRRVVNELEQGALGSAIFKPGMGTPIYLHQLTPPRAALAPGVSGWSVLAVDGPEPGGHHGLDGVVAGPAGIAVGIKEHGDARLLVRGEEREPGHAGHDGHEEEKERQVPPGDAGETHDGQPNGGQDQRGTQIGLQEDEERCGRGVQPAHDEMAEPRDFHVPAREVLGEHQHQHELHRLDRLDAGTADLEPRPHAPRDGREHQERGEGSQRDEVERHQEDAVVLE